MVWLFDHPAVAIATFMLLEKLVLLSPAKWDDILVDGIYALFKSTRPNKVGS